MSIVITHECCLRLGNTKGIPAAGHADTIQKTKKKKGHSFELDLNVE